MSVQIALSECAAILNAPTPAPEQDYVRSIIHTLMQTTEEAAWVLFVPRLSNDELSAINVKLSKVFPNLAFTLNVEKPVYEIKYALK